MEFTYGHGDRPLPGYTIMRAVGRGAFGEVYFAVSDGGREVALKRLVENAEIEIRGVKRCINIKSPHLVSVFDIMTGQDGRPFIVMEYVAGPSLRDILNEHPHGMPVERIRLLLGGIMAALACLHGQSIVHRDLKPENIFLDEGYIKIGDYGLAKHISVSQPGRQTINLGTVHYMAPEIATGSYDHRVDIYALGVLLYEMLTGQVPFLGKDMYEIALKHAASSADLENVPPPFRMIVGKAMAKDPRERYGSVQELADDLGIELNGTHATPPTASPAPAPSSERPRAEKPFAPAAGAAAGSKPRLSLYAGEGWAGRMAMTLVAAMAMAIALSIAPPDMDLSFRRVMKQQDAEQVLTVDGQLIAAAPNAPLTAYIGWEFFPVLFTLMLGSMATASIGLWFARRSRAPGESSLACRLMVASVVTIIGGAVFLIGPYGYLSQNLQSWNLDMGLAQRFKDQSFQRMLFILFLGLLTVNWLKAASPDRKTRVSLGQAILAAVIVGILTEPLGFDSFAPAGMIAGLCLCVSFLAPTFEDVGIAPAARGRHKVYLEKRWHVRETPPAAGERSHVTYDEPRPVNGGRRGVPHAVAGTAVGQEQGAGHFLRRIRWWWWVLLAFFLVWFMSFR
jgi:hypothetical protein